MASFNTLKKSTDQLSRLNKEVEKLKSPTKFEKKVDERFWKPEVDKAGNGSAIIRFLPTPAVDGEDVFPWVRVFDHAFKGPTGKWYIEKSLTTPTPSFPKGRPDPVGEYNSQLWGDRSIEDSSYRASERKQARAQKRRLSFYSNIYVVSDPKHPENEGKVFLYRYGKKIFDKILLSMNPEFEGDVEVNPFDLWKGANFRLRIRNVEGYPNYDQSTFATPGPLLDSDDEMEKVYNAEYSLQAFIAPDQFKSYDVLKSQLEAVLGTSVSGGTVTETTTKELQQASTPKERAAAIKTQLDDDAVDDDDELAKFKALAD